MVWSVVFGSIVGIVAAAVVGGALHYWGFKAFVPRKEKTDAKRTE